MSSGLNSNRTGLLFKEADNSAQLDLRSVSFTNEISVGFRIFSAIDPYFECFIMPNFSYSLIAIQKLGGKSDFKEVISYQEIYPNLNTTWESIAVGLGLKIRTQLKNRMRFDYGLSYRYSFTNYPTLGMRILVPRNEFSANVKPNIHLLSIDFIYYFRKRA